MDGLPGIREFLKFKKEFSERVFEMGIAEQNMMGVAAGMSMTGKIPARLAPEENSPASAISPNGTGSSLPELMWMTSRTVSSV